MAGPKWPHDHEAKHRYAAYKGWETRRGKLGFATWRESMRVTMKTETRLSRSKKLTPDERRRHGEKAKRAGYLYKQLGAHWQGGWERFARRV